MKSMIFTFAIVAAAMIGADANAQCSDCATGGEVVVGGSGTCGTDAGRGGCATGRCRGGCGNGLCACATPPYNGPTCTGLRGAGPAGTVYRGLRDHYSPQRFYAYSKRGQQATWTDAWNRNMATSNPWHGQHSYWRWDAPTALVVPPTASFQTKYGWGVGSTQSVPIHHQFGRYSASGSGTGQGMFSRTPYWPSNTDQFGVYPVRGPWN